MANDPKNDPNNYYPRYATDNCADCNDMYYTKWGRVRATNYDLFLPDNNIISACRNEKGFYPFRDERGLGMAELEEPVDYALASSGALSLGTTAGTDRSISAEFGGSTPHALSEYYGGSSGIPWSGAIDFSDFHGKTAANDKFRWMYISLSSNSGNQVSCTCCSLLCTYKCCIHPSSSSLHNCLERLDMYITTCDCDAGNRLASCYSSGCNYNGILIGGSHTTGYQGFGTCLCCAVETHGAGLVSTMWMGGVHACGIYSNYCYYSNRLYNQKYRLVSPSGNYGYTYAGGYTLMDNSAFWEEIDLSGYSASTHAILCNVCCISGIYDRGVVSCCARLSNCTTFGDTTYGDWICTGEVHSIPNTSSCLLIYGDPCSRTYGGGRQVFINTNIDHECWGLRGSLSEWATSGGTSWGGARLVVNSLIWASRGVPR